MKNRLWRYKFIVYVFSVCGWLITKLKNWLWGYDFFISCHWASGGTYAVNLAARLREKGYEVFLDRAEYAMGDDWERVGEVALRNTQRLILIATRGARSYRVFKAQTPNYSDLFW